MFKKKKEKDPNRLTTGKVFAFNGRGSSLACNFIVLMYLTYYCTDMLGMPATLVGIVLMLSKLFDGVTDLFAGFIVDRTNTRWGKARPYEFSILGVWFFTILMYSCPDIGMTGKAIWIFVTYTFVNSVFATFLNTTEPIYLARAFRNEEDRTKLVAFNGFLIMIFCMVVSISFPMLMAKFGTTAKGWIPLVSIYAIPLSLIGMSRFLFIKEKNSDVDSTKISMKDFLLALKSSSYIYFLGGTTLLFNIVTGVIATVGAYYFTYIVGNISALSIVHMVSIITLPIIFIFPFLVKKLNNAGVIILGAILGAIACVARLWAGSNVMFIVITFIIMGFGSMTLSYLPPLMIIECMDYGQWKTKGKRIEGAYTCVSGFAAKVGAGLASSVTGILMGIAGYDGTLEVQSASATQMIVNLYSVVPAILFIFIIFFMIKFRKMELQLPKIREEMTKSH